MVDPKDELFGGMLCCAVRYALGRTSSAPYTVTQFIRPLLPYLSDNAICNLKRDISEFGDYGDSCDTETWKEFLTDIMTEIRKRGIM